MIVCSIAENVKVTMMMVVSIDGSVAPNVKEMPLKFMNNDLLRK
jgi:hypothetical protein